MHGCPARRACILLICACLFYCLCVCSQQRTLPSRFLLACLLVIRSSGTASTGSMRRVRRTATAVAAPIGRVPLRSQQKSCRHNSSHSHHLLGQSRGGAPPASCVHLDLLKQQQQSEVLSRLVRPVLEPVQLASATLIVLQYLDAVAEKLSIEKSNARHCCVV